MNVNILVMERLRDFFTFTTMDLVTNFTYILMDNFCPCFYSIISFQYGIEQHVLRKKYF